jgi:hypothetical protein
MISWYIHKCNFNYDHKGCGFPAQVFTKLTNVQQHSLQISYTKLHLTQTIDVETTDNSFMPPRKIWCSTRQFSWNSLSVNILLYWSVSKSDENLKNRGKISFMTLSKVWLPLYWFSRHNYSVALSRLLHKFSPKSVAKYEEYGQKFIHATVLIFKKLALAWRCFVHSSYTKFHAKPTDSLVADTVSQKIHTQTWTPQNVFHLTS